MHANALSRARIPLATLTSPQSNRLSVLLQLGDQLIALLNHIVVLLVLVVWSIRLDDFVDTVDCAWDAICGDEVGKVSIKTLVWASHHTQGNLLVQEVDRHAKVVGHAPQTNYTVALEKLLISSQSHLTDIPLPVLVQISILAQERLLNST